MYFVSKSLNR